jgi:hypothetical protein
VGVTRPARVGHPINRDDAPRCRRCPRTVTARPTGWCRTAKAGTLPWSRYALPYLWTVHVVRPMQSLVECLNEAKNNTKGRESYIALNAPRYLEKNLSTSARWTGRGRRIGDVRPERRIAGDRRL